MNLLPKDSELYRIFEEEAREILPPELMKPFEDDIYDLVNGLKDLVNYIVSNTPDARVDIHGQVAKKLAVWCNEKEKTLVYNAYTKFIRENGVSNKTLPFRDFVGKGYFRKFEKILKLGIRKGLRIRVKGYGDIFTIRGVSTYLSVAVEELSDKYFNPEEIIEVIA
ncbi:hypothetical protein J7J83_04430 [bacterium]|nr:hypothetical protein [bacterium]